MRTQIEIADEISRLKALKPTGIWAKQTRSKILIAIEELEHGVDDTADEWNELSSSEQDTVMEARQWKDSIRDDKPSEGWDSLVE